RDRRTGRNGAERSVPVFPSNTSGISAMPEAFLQLPVRRSDLVSWPVGDKGSYLIRDRRGGLTFQVGEAAGFLLARLDGRYQAREMCSAFARRFVQPLTDEDLADFLSLANERGLLQPETSPPATPAQEWLDEPSSSARLGRTKSRLSSIASRLLSAATASLQATAGLFGGMASRVDWL